MADRKALVLGATGMVGMPVALALKEEGWSVTGAASLSEPTRAKPLAEAGIEMVKYDVLEDSPERLPEVDVVFLEVWNPGRPDLIWPINYFGIGRVVERYAGKADFINGCTINVYGDQPGVPAEDAPCRPTSDYGRSRFAQEKLIDYFCDRSGSRGVHVRYAHSNTATRGYVRRFAEKILRGESLGDTPDCRTQVIALEDFVRVTVGSVDHLTSPSIAVNCCHPTIWTQRELAHVIWQRLGKRGQVVFDRASGGREVSVCADVSRMLEWFGEPTVPLDAVIGRVVKDLIG